MAAEVLKFCSADVCEIARNSILMCGKLIGAGTGRSFV